MGSEGKQGRYNGNDKPALTVQMVSIQVATHTAVTIGTTVVNLASFTCPDSSQCYLNC
jgi:hypothetical protein